MERTQLARAAHEMNRAYCAAMGDLPEAASQIEWDDAPQAHRDSLLAVVDMHLANPDATPEQAHDSWLAAKTADGWVHGDVKDVDAKVHPCMLPYWKLPNDQRVKDYLFRAVVHTLKGVAEAPPAAQVLIPVPGPTMAIDSSYVSVKYIGARETYTDGTFGSRIEFKQGESCNVPAAIAAKMLKHPTVYVRGEPTARVVNVAQEKTPDDDNAQDMRDSIATMDKDALATFAKTHYQAKVDMRQNLEVIRAKVTGLFDQYGAA